MEEYLFNNYQQYIDYIVKNINKLSMNEIKKFGTLCNKTKKNYTNEELCNLFKDFCDKINLKDYYVY